MSLTERGPAVGAKAETTTAMAKQVPSENRIPTTDTTTIHRNVAADDGCPSCSPRCLAPQIHYSHRGQCNLKGRIQKAARRFKLLTNRPRTQEASEWFHHTSPMKASAVWEVYNPRSEQRPAPSTTHCTNMATLKEAGQPGQNTRLELFSGISITFGARRRSW